MFPHLAGYRLPKNIIRVSLFMSPLGLFCVDPIHRLNVPLASLLASITFWGFQVHVKVGVEVSFLKMNNNLNEDDGEANDGEDEIENMSLSTSSSSSNSVKHTSGIISLTPHSKTMRQVPLLSTFYIRRN